MGRTKKKETVIQNELWVRRIVDKEDYVTLHIYNKKPDDLKGCMYSVVRQDTYEKLFGKVSPK